MFDIFRYRRTYDVNTLLQGVKQGSRGAVRRIRELAAGGHLGPEEIQVLLDCNVDAINEAFVDTPNLPPSALVRLYAEVQKQESLRLRVRNRLVESDLSARERSSLYVLQRHYIYEAMMLTPQRTQVIAHLAQLKQGFRDQLLFNIVRKRPDDEVLLYPPEWLLSPGVRLAQSDPAIIDRLTRLARLPFSRLSPQEQQEYARSQSELKQQSVAEFSTDPELVSRLASSKFQIVREAAEKNPAFDRKLADRAISESEERKREAQRELKKRTERAEREAITAAKKREDKRRQDLVTEIRMLSGWPNKDLSVLQAIQAKPKSWLREAAAYEEAHKALVDQQAKIARSTDKTALLALASWPDLDLAVRRELVDHPSLQVRKALAKMMDMTVPETRNWARRYDQEQLAGSLPETGQGETGSSSESKGFVYILINPSMPGMVKVGKTTRSASHRIEELSAASGVPTPFEVVLELPFSDCHRAEETMHARLGRYRVTQAREFFRCEIQVAVKALIALHQHEG